MLNFYQKIGKYNSVSVKKRNQKVSKDSCFFGLETDVLYGRTIFLLKWSTISREAWLQLKCDSTESDAAGLQILALPVVSRRKQGKAHVFLD